MLLQRQVARTFGADAVDLVLRYQVSPLPISVGLIRVEGLGNRGFISLLCRAAP